MNYLFTPPNTHYDGGLGITACSFSKATDSLRKNKYSIGEMLPFCYLQRHAIELFLKSGIVILHKKFEEPYGEGFSIESPAIKIKEKWISLSRTHNLSDLYQYFKFIYKKVMDKLPELIRLELPENIDGKINLVSGSDPKSTYFRYPEATNTVQDAKKSVIKKESLESMQKKSNGSGVPFKCVLMLDQDENVVDSYNLNSSPIPDILKALKELNEFFNGVHIAFRVHLTNGS